MSKVLKVHPAVPYYCAVCVGNYNLDEEDESLEACVAVKFDAEQLLSDGRFVTVFESLVTVIWDWKNERSSFAVVETLKTDRFAKLQSPPRPRNLGIMGGGGVRCPIRLGITSFPPGMIG